MTKPIHHKDIFRAATTTSITKDNPRFTVGMISTINIKGLGIYNIVLDNYVTTNNLCVLLQCTKNPNEFIKFSLNPEKKRMDSRHFVAKIYSENERLVQPMLATGLFRDTREVYHLPFSTAPIWALV